MEGRSVATLCLSSSHLYSGNKWTSHVPLSATSKWVLCPANRMVFIRLFESWAGLLGFAWTALFVPWEEAEEGKSCRAEEIQTCLTSYFFFSSSTFKRNFSLSPFCRPQHKICWIFFPVLIPTSWPEEVCYQPPAFNLSSLHWHQSHSLIPLSVPKHDCWVAVKPPHCVARLRMLQTRVGIGRVHAQEQTLMCCQGLCKVYKLPYFGLWTLFDLLEFK